VVRDLGGCVALREVAAVSGFSLTCPEPDVHLRGDELGRSYTPEPVARAIMLRLRDRFDLDGRTRMIELCLGGGSFVRAGRAVLGALITVVGVDRDGEAPGAVLCDEFVHGDARDLDTRGPPFDLAVTNPPFGKDVGQEATLAIVNKARRSARHCALLLPLDYQTQTGFEHHIEECTEIWPLLPRPFPHDRGMCVYVWQRGVLLTTTFRPLRWKVAA
jgi:hypothetical protein